MANKKIILEGTTYSDIGSLCVTGESNTTVNFYEISDATVSAADMLSGKIAYTSAGTKATGTIQTKTASNITVSGPTVTVAPGYYASQQTKDVSSGSVVVGGNIISVVPSFSIANSTGIVTVTGTQKEAPIYSLTEGYITSSNIATASDSASIDTSSNTFQLTTKGAATYTPGTANQTIAANRWLTGVQTIAGDSDLKAANIKKGVQIFNVTGSYDLVPVGTVLCMNTKTNPDTTIGGTWTLIDKEFADYYDYSDASKFTINDTNTTSVTNPLVSRHGHSITLRLTFVNKVAMADSTLTFGTWSLSALGLASQNYALYYLAYSDDGNAMAMMDMLTSGAVRSNDIVSKTSATSIAAGKTWNFTVTFTALMDDMLDSACDKFYFKRTA